jgi:hypothetical protein
MSTTTIRQSVFLNPVQIRDLEISEKIMDKSQSDSIQILPSSNQIGNKCKKLQLALSELDCCLEEDKATYRNMDLFRKVFNSPESDFERRSYFREKAVLLNDVFEKCIVDEKANESRRFSIKEKLLDVIFEAGEGQEYSANGSVLDELWLGLSPQEKLFFYEKSILLNDQISLLASGKDAIDTRGDIAKKYLSDFLYSGDGRPDKEEAGRNSLREIWKQLAEIIGGGAKKNLNDFASALDKYTSLYQGLTNIMAKFGNWISADGDSKMKVNIDAIKKELNGLYEKYSPPGEDGVIAGSTTAGMSKSEAEAICEKLGLDEGSLHQNGDGTYCVVVNLEQVKIMISQLPASESMSIASYNVWKAGFDAQMNRIEDVLQARGQKYSNSFSRFENLHKTISSIIEAMKNMLEKFLQF